MKVKTKRCVYSEYEERTLEDNLNEIGAGNIMFVLSSNQGCKGEVYTIVYMEREAEEIK